jgi:hypothetical protein
MTRVPLIVAALALVGADSSPTQTVVRLKVRPMAAPKPALKYQLLPELAELNPGNPAQGYVRCFSEQRFFFYSKEGVAERTRYLAMPLAELPAEKLRDYGRGALRHADWSARLDSPDWQVLRHVQHDGMDLLVPEAGPLRVLGLALQVRFRAEVALRRFDDALHTAKTMLAMARHLGEYPSEAANLTGLVVANGALDRLEEMLAQPGCPNLYWALTDLPCPLVELRKGFQGDRLVVATDLRALNDRAVMTEVQLEEVVSRFSGRLGFAREQAGQAPRSLRKQVEARVEDAARVDAARRRLVEAGTPQDVVRKFSPLQVILLDEKRDYELRRDEAMKLAALAPWQVDAVAGGDEPSHGWDGLFADILPKVVKARRAQGRLEQRIALLRHVEALRLYAAEHDGKLPQTLAEVGVPLPEDPFTGKPFAYKVEQSTAQLCGSPPRGEEKNPGFNVRYEVTVAR